MSCLSGVSSWPAWKRESGARASPGVAARMAAARHLTAIILSYFLTGTLKYAPRSLRNLANHLSTLASVGECWRRVDGQDLATETVLPQVLPRIIFAPS